MIPFELAGGSVIGTDHRSIPRNNQDAWHVARSEDAMVAVVCDGCGSGLRSEVGAAIGSRLICRAILDELAAHGEDLFLWARVERSVLSSVDVLATQMGGNYRKTIEDHFLFTVVGAVLTPLHAVFFDVGDGMTMINGVPSGLGQWPGNAPPYLAYQLLEGRSVGFTPSELRLEVTWRHDVDDVDTFLIGCDGAGRPGLLEVCEREDQTLPGFKNLPVGPISQFWTQDSYFANPVAISRRLKLIARDWPPRDPERGLLADDTTIVVGRRT